LYSWDEDEGKLETAGEGNERCGKEKRKVEFPSFRRF
jgi:hypothetical protein